MAQVVRRFLLVEAATFIAAAVMNVAASTSRNRRTTCAINGCL